MTVRVYYSSNYGAPAVTSNAAGTGLTVYEQCLVTGFGAQTVTISRIADTVQVVTPLAHGLMSGQFISISGADQNSYNGEFPITVTSAYAYTYKITTSPATPATGTITAKLGGAGWSMPFSKTNVKVFKQGAGSNGRYLRLDDTTNFKVMARGYENMFDVDTGTGPFPVTRYDGLPYVVFPKPISVVTVQPRDWVIVATEKMFYIYMKTYPSEGYGIMACFGDFISYLPGDMYNTIISGSESSDSTYTSTSFQSIDGSVGNGVYAPRAYTQVGAAIPLPKIVLGRSASYMGVHAPRVYPDPVTKALNITSIKLWETNTLRGELPGILQPMHDKPLLNFDILNGTGPLTGKTFLALRFGYGIDSVITYQPFLEISNTW